MSTLKTILSTAALLALATTSEAKTLLVPSQHRTIQAAVNNASPGDTIEIASGRYAEDVVVSHRDHLTLRSSAIRGSTVIRSIALDNSDWLWLERLEFDGSSRAVSLWNCDRATLQDCRFRNSRTGLASHGSDLMTLLRCDFEASVSNAVSIASASGLEIDRCTFAAGADLSLRYVYMPILSQNRMDHAGLVALHGCHRALLFDNELVETMMRVRWSSQVTVRYNESQGQTGNAIGLVLEQCLGAMLDENYFWDMREGIQVIGGGSHTLHENSIRNSRAYGIRLWSVGNRLEMNGATNSGVLDLWDANPAANSYFKNNFGTSNL